MNNKLFVKKKTGRIIYQFNIKSESNFSPCSEAALYKPAFAPYLKINHIIKPKKATIKTSIRFAISMFSPLVTFS